MFFGHSPVPGVSILKVPPWSRFLHRPLPTIFQERRHPDRLRHLLSIFRVQHHPNFLPRILLRIHLLPLITHLPPLQRIPFLLKFHFLRKLVEAYFRRANGIFVAARKRPWWLHIPILLLWATVRPWLDKRTVRQTSSLRARDDKAVPGFPFPEPTKTENPFFVPWQKQQSLLPKFQNWLSESPQSALHAPAENPGKERFCFPIQSVHLGAVFVSTGHFSDAETIADKNRHQHKKQNKRLHRMQNLSDKFFMCVRDHIHCGPLKTVATGAVPRNTVIPKGIY